MAADAYGGLEYSGYGHIQEAAAAPPVDTIEGSARCAMDTGVPHLYGTASLSDLLGPMVELPSFAATALPSQLMGSCQKQRQQQQQQTSFLSSTPQQKQSKPASAPKPRPKPPPRPIAELLSKRTEALRTRVVRQSPAVETHVCEKTCVTIISNHDPALCICISSGHLHYCDSRCPFTREGTEEACPLTGIVSDNYENRRFPNPQFDDRFTAAKADETDPIGAMLKNVRTQQSVPDENEQWRRARGDVLSVFATSVILDTVLSKGRFAYDVNRLAVARSKLADTLLTHLRKCVKVGDCSISVAFIAQQLHATARALEREGACITDPSCVGLFKTEITAVAERSAETWMLLERQYEELKDKERSEEERRDAEEADRKVPLLKKAGRACRVLDLPKMTYTHRYHVLATLYSMEKEAPNLTAILPSHACLLSLNRSFDVRLFRAHKDALTL